MALEALPTGASLESLVGDAVQALPITNSLSGDVIGSLRSRDRRRFKRHGAVAAAAAAAPSESMIACSGPVQSKASVSSVGVTARSGIAAARDRKSSDCQMLLSGQEGKDGHAVVRYAAHGVPFAVDIAAMLQHDASTGQALQVKRLKAGSWSVKKSSQKSNGWSPYPIELSLQLEHVYQSLLPPDASSSLASSDASPCPLLQALAKAGAEPGSMPEEEVRTAADSALEAAAAGSRSAEVAVKLVTALVLRQELRCTPMDARRAGLVAGSMTLLQIVLRSAPGMQLIGLEVFDQKYAGIKLNEDGRKNGIRSLLSRGMVLGRQAPLSKLLRKIQADSIPLWEARLLDAMLREFSLLPEQVVVRIKSFMV